MSLPNLYTTLAKWWPLVSDPADYEEEVEFFAPLFHEYSAIVPKTLLELGSGGGNNAHFLGKKFEMTLVDLSPEMLEVSQQLNPTCRHVCGDMADIRLDEAFDGIFVHDAVMYLTTPQRLQALFETAYIHCRPGGCLVVAPDAVKETLEAGTETGGEDGPNGAVRYLEWTHEAHPSEDTFLVDYALIITDEEGRARVEHDRHKLGVFSRSQWVDWLRRSGFQPEIRQSPWKLDVFIGRKPL